MDRQRTMDPKDPRPTKKQRPTGKKDQTENRTGFYKEPNRTSEQKSPRKNTERQESTVKIALKAKKKRYLYKNPKNARIEKSKKPTKQLDAKVYNPTSMGCA